MESETIITCTTGNKGANNFSPHKLEILVNGNRAILEDGVFFYYGL